MWLIKGSTLFGVVYQSLGLCVWCLKEIQFEKNKYLELWDPNQTYFTCTLKVVLVMHTLKDYRQRVRFSCLYLETRSCGGQKCSQSGLYVSVNGGIYMT